MKWEELQDLIRRNGVGQKTIIRVHEGKVGKHPIFHKESVDLEDENGFVRQVEWYGTASCSCGSLVGEGNTVEGRCWCGRYLCSKCAQLCVKGEAVCGRHAFRTAHGDVYCSRHVPGMVSKKGLSVLGRTISYLAREFGSNW